MKVFCHLFSTMITFNMLFIKVRPPLFKGTISLYTDIFVVEKNSKRELNFQEYAKMSTYTVLEPLKLLSEDDHHPADTDDTIL